MRKSFNDRGMGLLSLLFAVVIIAMIFYFATKVRPKSPEVKNGYFRQVSLDAASYKGTLDTSKTMIDAAVKTKSQQSEGF